MPDLSAIETALVQALATVDDIGTIAWPGRSADPARPFVMFEHVPTTWDNATVDGSETRAAGYFVASACAEHGYFTTAANLTAQSVIDAFTPGRRMDGVCIMGARPLPGYFDGAGWRQPVRVDYRSEDSMGDVMPEIEMGDDW